MKKILGSIVIVIVALWLVATVAAKGKKGAVRGREWPTGLGRLDSVPARYPDQTRNAAAIELDRLAGKAAPPGDPDPVATYVRGQLQRIDRTIEPGPPIDEKVEAIRAHLLMSERLVWDVEIDRAASAPLPNLSSTMKLSRLLTASALERARLGDTGAWDDLRAQRVISRAMWQRPELVSAMIGMAIDRNIIAAARKMPLPVPEWFNEIRTFDHRKAMLAALQAETWMISAAIREYGDGDDAGRNWVRRLADRTVMKPYTELSRADLIAQQRQRASEIAKRTTCALELPVDRAPWWNRPAQYLAPNTVGAWQRVFRLRAELELTEHALGLRSGSQSQCSDGHWVITPSSVKFSKPIPLDGPPGVIPLEIRR